MNIGARLRTMLKAPHSVANARALLVCGSLLLAAQQPASAVTTLLADQPLFTYNAVPGNLLLALSVEFPTAISVANSGAYVNTKSYLGIFDPAKCYLYNFNAQTYNLTAVADPYNYFYPTKAAPSNNNCAGTAADPEWSGNYLNWAGMQTIDPFRTALTGGYRSLDADSNTQIITGVNGVGVNIPPAPAVPVVVGIVTLPAGLTVLEKAWASNQGSASSNFPDRFAAKSAVAGITPLGAATASWSTVGTRIWNSGNLMYFDISTNGNGTIQTAIDGGTSGTTGNSTPYNPASISSMAADTVYSVKIRVQVCVTGALSESNCTVYGTWSKPEGLMQQYSQTIRYGAFGYLNEAGTAIDGGVLRARMNFVGPTKPVVNSTAINNTPVNYGGIPGNNGTAEWSGTTGVYYQEPDLIDETATNAYFTGNGALLCTPQPYTAGLGGMATGACAYNSGTINYLNKFGETSHSYKTDDPVSELYYASVRYFRWFNGNTTTISSSPIAAPVLDAVPEYDLKSTNGSTNTTWVDGFPVIGACGSPGGQNSCTNSWSRGRYQALTTTTPGTPITKNGYTCGATPITNPPLPAPQVETCLGVDLDDPIQYACQKNFILGIGDIHTHADGDLPGGGPYASEEPTTQPPSVTNDTTMNFPLPATAITTYAAPGVATIINIQSGTDMTAALENLETPANTPPSADDNNSGSSTTITCSLSPNLAANATGCSGSSHFKYLVSGGDQSTYFMAGEAYDAHTRDIRPHEFLDPTGSVKNSGIQTVSTYWLDVLEGQDYKWRNQFWLTAKYGGFSLPTSGWNTYGATTPINNVIQGPLSKSSWSANGNTDVGFGSTTAANARALPDHYYNASQASLMVAGLTSAFQSISNALSAFTTSFSLAQPTVTSTNNVAYSSNYSAQYWSGDVTGAAITGFDTSNNPIYGAGWDGALLLSQANPSLRAIATCCSSLTTAPGVAFTTSGMTADTMGTSASLYSSLSAPTLSASADQMIAWLRGDHSQEVVNGGTLRTRPPSTTTGINGAVLGDIVDSAVLGVAPPSAYYSDSANPGYSTFKNNCSTRSQMAYVGGNDGMLHAFNGTVGQALSGQEIFAYIPSPTFNGPTNAQTDGLQSLANPTYVHHFFVDSTPTVTDIYIAGSGSTCPAGASNGWQSLLISGMGKGGRSYFAIDVTNPDAMNTSASAATKVKWEFTDPTMGFTYGEPVVVKTKRWGWTVIVTSGYNTPDGNGYFYFINPATGALLQRIEVGINPTTGGAYTGFPVTGASVQVGMGPATAFVNDYTDYTADAVYAGDLLGDVWRIDLTGTSAYATPLLFAQLTTTSSGKPQPVTQRVLTEIQPSSNARRILIGTGELLSTADISSTDVQSIYSLIDGTSSPGQFFVPVSNPLPGGYAFPVVKGDLAPVTLATGATAADLTSKPEGFYVDLPLASSGAAYRVNVPMAEDQGELAVVANAPVGDACDPSGTHIDYALDIGSGQSYVQTSSTNTTLLPYYTPPSGAGEGTGASFVQDGTGSSHPYFCNSVGGCEQPPGKTPPGTGLTRVNWREIPSPE